MKINIWMPWFIADYEQKTKELTLEEDCVYRRALDFLWQNPAGIPRVSSRLTRCLRITEEEYKRTAWVLEKFLKIDGDYFRSDRLDEEYLKAEKRKEIARENGKLGGRPNNPAGYPSGIPEPNLNANPEKSSSPSPSPLPLQLPLPSERKQKLVEQARPRSVNSEIAEKIFETWKAELNHPRAKLDRVRRKMIESRLAEGYSQERIEAAIRGIKLSAHHMGQNDREAVYDDIELICRSGAYVDRFADLEEKSGLGTPRPVWQRRYTDAMLPLTAEERAEHEAKKQQETT